jgi:single-strand DNA-binding protein
MTVNKATLLGHVGKDPEIRKMDNGNEVATFNLATSDYWKDKQSGETKSKTEWHRIVIFSQGLVTLTKNYIKKGAKLYIEGKLQTRKWTDNQGIEKYTTEIVLQGFNSLLKIIDSKKSDATEKDSVPETKKKEKDNKFIDEFDDEVPF